MKNFESVNIDRLNKIITIRMTDEDYETLLTLSENNSTDVSKIIRSIISSVIDLNKNNYKSK